MEKIFNNKKTKITPKDWEVIYEYYAANITSPHVFNEIFNTIEPYIEMCKKSFKVIPELWDEFEVKLMEDIHRAFITYDYSRGYKFSTWVYQLSKQSAYGFIKDTCRENKREIISLSIDSEDNNFYYLENNEKNPEEKLSDKESNDAVNISLNSILDIVLRGPIEKDVYIMKNGIFDNDKMKPEEIAYALNLTEKTVEQIITRNNNSMAQFRKYLRLNGISYETFTKDDLLNYITYIKNKH